MALRHSAMPSLRTRRCAWGGHCTRKCKGRSMHIVLPLQHVYVSCLRAFVTTALPQKWLRTDAMHVTSLVAGVHTQSAHFSLVPWSSMWMPCLATPFLDLYMPRDSGQGQMTCGSLCPGSE